MAGSAKRDQEDPTAVLDGGRHSRTQPASPSLDRVVQAQIGDKLRAMYGELSEQPLPDRLTAILSRLGGDAGSERNS